MHVVVANNIYPPIMAGGAELIVAWLAEGLAARGHRVTVVSTCGPEMEPYPVETVNGVTVIRFFPRVEVPAEVPRSERVAVATQGWVDALAVAIREHPEDWHMLQKVFVEDLDPERYARTRAAAGEGTAGAGPATGGSTVEGAAGAAAGDPERAA